MDACLCRMDRADEPDRPRGALPDKEKRRAVNVPGAALYWMPDDARGRMIEEEQRK